MIIGISRMSTIGTTVDSGNLPSRPFEGMLSEWTIRIDNQKNSLLNQCRHGFPPQSPYLGFSTPTLCYINKLETREAILEKELGSNINIWKRYIERKLTNDRSLLPVSEPGKG